MRDLDRTRIKKSALALVFVIAWASVVLGGQIGAGVKLHADAETDTAATFVTINGTFGYFAIDGGILWESLESIGDSTAALRYYGQAKLRLPILDILAPYGAVGVEAITIPSLSSTESFLLAVGGVELTLSERGIPFSVFAELNWTSPLDNIGFGEAVIFFGARVDLFTVSFARQDPGIEEPAAVASEAEPQSLEPAPAPCPTCEDDDVLRRWRQGG